MIRTLNAAAFGAALFIGPAGAAESSMGFSVDVTLSPIAATELTARHEKIIVLAMWYGEPTEAAKSHADDMEQIDLGSEKVRLPESGGRAEVTGRKVAVNRMGWIRGRAVQVLINVFSARLSGPNNLLNCSVFEDSLTAARQKPIAVGCKLISEP
jgi:hypothetical protein